MLLVLAVGGFATSCSEDDVDKGPAGGILGNGVYFPSTVGSVQFIEEGQTQLQIPVCRSVDMGNFEIQIISDTTDPDIFTFPEYAQFAEGELETVFTISINAPAVESGVEYGISLLLSDDDNLSSYGAPSYEFTAMIDPWIDMEGEGTFEDYLLFAETYKVKIRRHVNNPNMYRVVDPWSEGLAAEGYVESGMVASSYTENFDFEVDPETGLVTFSDLLYPLNLSSQGLGALTMYHPGRFRDTDVSYNCQLMEGVFQIAPIILDPNFYGFDNHATPTIYICLPGCVNIQPQMAAEYTGTFTDPEGNTEAVFEVMTNEDVSTYLWSVVDAEADRNAALAAMISGEDPNVQEEIGATALEGTELRYFLDTPGSYVALFLPIAANSGEAIYGSPIAVEFDFSIGGGVAPADFTAEFEITNITHNSATVSVTPAANNLTYYYGITSKENWEALPESKYGTIDNWMLAIWEAYAADYGVELMELVEQAELLTKGPDSTEFKKELEAETTYVVYAYCIDTSTLLARSAVSSVEFTTNAAPTIDAEYAAWLGDWTVTDSKGKSFVINVAEDSINESFTVTNWSSMKYIPEYTREVVPMTALYTAEKGLGLTSETLGYFDEAGNTILATCYIGNDDSLYPGFIDSGEALMAAELVSDGNATIEVAKAAFDDGTSTNLYGVESFILDFTEGKVYILDEAQVDCIAPFTLVKQAAASTSSVNKGQHAKELVRARFNEQSLSSHPTLVRRNFIAAHNHVMVR